MNKIQYKLIPHIVGIILGSSYSVACANTNNILAHQINWNAVVIFLIFVCLTLGITYWAAKKIRNTNDFYVAGGGITGLQNGLAIAGDYMSAASFLGISAMVFDKGFDGLIYSIGFLVGWPIVTFLIAERLRNLGRFTFVDVASYRLNQTSVRIPAAISTLCVVLVYLIAQMVGAGKLIELLFGLNYIYAIFLVGGLMVLYVLFGGMLATTWVQIIKAVLLLIGASFMAIMALKSVNFSFEQFFSQAIEIKRSVNPNADIMRPGGLVSNPIDAISLGLALIFGTAGLPHILMRFFTVKDAKEARKSVFYATGFMGYFYILTVIIGFGAILFVTGNDRFTDEQGGIIGGFNMVAVHLSAAVGGDLFLGFMSAVTFATILAVVAGLTLSGVSAISHDLYASVIRKGKASQSEEVRVSKIATLVLGIIAILLGIVFEKQNIAFLVGLAFAIAAAANFPVLLLSMFWRGLTTKGAVIGICSGLLLSIVCIIIAPPVWEKVFGNPAGSALNPYSNPAIFSIPVAFLTAWLFSITDKSKQAQQERAAFEAQYVRSITGIGIDKASEH